MGLIEYFPGKRRRGKLFWKLIQAASKSKRKKKSRSKRWMSLLRGKGAIWYQDTVN
jgi:hypothetical protein